jgi:glutathione synthase/RimK-type ligase-like ATP-grasp enzyme
LKNIKLGILKDYSNNYQLYIEACKHLQVKYEVVDFLSPDWIQFIKKSKCDGFLCHPPDNIQEQKSIYDERLYFLNKVLSKPVYPSYESLYIYENKRNMAYWLEINDFPYPETRIFSRKKDALDYFDSVEFPIVLKTNIGAGGSGVEIINHKLKAKRITQKIFGRVHPAITFGRVRFSRKFYGIPLPLFGRVQKHYMIVQKFYKIKWEWRIIKIGDTYSGHQKLLKGQFASGSDKVGWVKPPEELLHMVKELCEKGGFDSMAVDIFETTEGRFLVNELQAIFGSFIPYQMKIDEKPGRYVYKNGKFNFEEGEFHQYGSNLLRVKRFLEQLSGEY